MTSQEMTLPQIDDEMIGYLNIIKDPTKSNEEKEEARKKFNFLEGHMQNVNAKIIAANAKKVEGKVYGSLYDPTPQTAEQKAELMRLIDSVPDGLIDTKMPCIIHGQLDPTGEFINKE